MILFEIIIRYSRFGARHEFIAERLFHFLPTTFLDGEIWYVYLHPFFISFFIYIILQVRKRDV